VTAPRLTGHWTRAVCRKGHALEGDNRVDRGTRIGCRTCEEKARADSKRRKAQKAAARDASLGRRLPIQIGMTPAQLAEARAELDAAIARERAQRGAMGGRPRNPAHAELEAAS
jgi:hypothetical protein